MPRIIDAAGRERFRDSQGLVFQPLLNFSYDHKDMIIPRGHAHMLFKKLGKMARAEIRRGRHLFRVIFFLPVFFYVTFAFLDLIREAVNLFYYKNTYETAYFANTAMRQAIKVKLLDLNDLKDLLQCDRRRKP